MKLVHVVAFVLTVVGALNWGLLALFNLNLVTMLVGEMPMLEKLVYVLVGASGLYLLLTHQADCKVCSSKK